MGDTVAARPHAPTHATLMKAQRRPAAPSGPAPHSGLRSLRPGWGLVGLVGLKGCLGWRLAHSAACVIGTRGGEAPDDLGGGEDGQASCGGEHGERHGEWGG